LRLDHSKNAWHFSITVWGTVVGNVVGMTGHCGAGVCLVVDTGVHVENVEISG